MNNEVISESGKDINPAAPLTEESVSPEITSRLSFFARHRVIRDLFKFLIYTILSLAIIIVLGWLLLILKFYDMQYHPKFSGEIINKPPPAELWHSEQDNILGYKVLWTSINRYGIMHGFSNIMLQIPVKHEGGYISSSQNIHRVFYVEIAKKRYQFADVTDEISVLNLPDGYAMNEEIKIEKGRKLYYQIEIPKRNFKKVYGPFRVP